MKINRVVENPNAKANRATHNFVAWDPDECPRCMDCDVRAGGTASGWPCGEDTPREIVHEDGSITPVVEAGV